MHVWVKSGDQEIIVARRNVVEVVVEN
jgi:hypothetical protein